MVRDGSTCYSQSACSSSSGVLWYAATGDTLHHRQRKRSGPTPRMDAAAHSSTNHAHGSWTATALWRSCAPTRNSITCPGLTDSPPVVAYPRPPIGVAVTLTV